MDRDMGLAEGHTESKSTRKASLGDRLSDVVRALACLDVLGHVATLLGSDWLVLSCCLLGRIHVWICRISALACSSCEVANLGCGADGMGHDGGRS